MGNKLKTIFIFFILIFASNSYSQSAASLVDRAILKKNNQNYIGALDDLNYAIKLDPYIAKAYYYRGNVKMDLEKYEDAINDYNQSLKLDETVKEVYYNRGNAKFQIKKFNDAIEDYTHTIFIDSQYGPAYNNRGTAKLNIGQTESGCSDLKKAIQYGENNASFIFNNYCK
jgi:tetratricopeptide (TPR) repeat protein